MIRRLFPAARSAGLLLAAAAALGGPSPATAQGYPARPVTLIVSFEPGGSTDVSARAVAQELGAQLGQPVIVENRSGAGGRIGTKAAAQARPDGYTLLWGSGSSLTAAPALYPHQEHVATLVPVSLGATQPFVFATGPALGVRSLQEFIALARSRPRQLNFASAGMGSSNHLLGEIFMAVSGVQLTHVPYKGAVMAKDAVIRGDAQLMDEATGPCWAPCAPDSSCRSSPPATSAIRRCPTPPPPPRPACPNSRSRASSACWHRPEHHRTSWPASTRPCAPPWPRPPWPGRSVRWASPRPTARPAKWPRGSPKAAPPMPASSGNGRSVPNDSLFRRNTHAIPDLSPVPPQNPRHPGRPGRRARNPRAGGAMAQQAGQPRRALRRGRRHGHHRPADRDRPRGHARAGHRGARESPARHRRPGGGAVPHGGTGTGAGDEHAGAGGGDLAAFAVARRPDRPAREHRPVTEGPAPTGVRRPTGAR
ncbi:uncharacterized protein UPF0065 [Paracidovorax citrulli AAC00-1]|uniref:Uncharacterized protein UPF0065 n=1 Tax=Paracidovorax citrulli (strain AAC00-1) TaxID=397945 RepID=A1TSF1_PARC0|nr:uncharacterized protein UPF0065 [Paracidovorax citrulli AAC00-1]